MIPGQVTPRRKKKGIATKKSDGVKKKATKAQTKESRRMSEAKKAQRKAEVGCRGPPTIHSLRGAQSPRNEIKT